MLFDSGNAVKHVGPYQSNAVVKPVFRGCASVTEVDDRSA